MLTVQKRERKSGHCRASGVTKVEDALLVLVDFRYALTECHPCTRFDVSPMCAAVQAPRSLTALRIGARVQVRTRRFD